LAAVTVRTQVGVTFMSGPRDGETKYFETPSTGNDLVIVIGRREGCDILLEYDGQVSRLHVHLVYDPKNDRFYLIDQTSRNKTWVGQHALEPEQRTEIQPGTLFRVGRTWLRVDPPENSQTDEDMLPF